MKQTEVDYFHTQLEEFDAKLSGKLIPFPKPEKEGPTFFQRNKKTIYKIIQGSLFVDWMFVIPILIFTIKHTLIFTFCTLTGLVDVAVFTGTQRGSVVDHSMFISMIAGVGFYIFGGLTAFNFFEDELDKMRRKYYD